MNKDINKNNENIIDEPDIKWLDDPEIFRINQMPAHSDHDSSCEKISLNGKWKFAYGKNPLSGPSDFYKLDFDESEMDEINVPGHIEFAGYDKFNYINIMYPWEGHAYKRPPKTPLANNQKEGIFSQDTYNPTGYYRLHFDLPKDMEGKRVSVFFEGVEQAMYLWCNGKFIGYAEDSFTPSEFDLTDVIREKDNQLAVRVHKRSSAAFLEDQDFFRFFGIYRNVSFQAREDVHLEDFWIRPKYDYERKIGSPKLDIKLSVNKKIFETLDDLFENEKFSLQVNIKDKNNSFLINKSFSIKNLKDYIDVVSQNQSGDYLVNLKELLQEEIENVTPWDNKNPYLYELEINLFSNQQILERITHEFGFRKIEIKNNKITLNGKRLIICGVNRHEWSCKSGRAIGQSEMDWDMACMKRNNINAVRTCHYPDQIPWYYMCDKNGIYMMSECNLETHGSWAKFAAIEGEWAVPGSFSTWKEVTLDRAKTNFEVFKNHTSILFWSLGNEAYVGETLVEMNKYFKEKDPDRLVHYEGVFWVPCYKDRISDVESRMYAYPKDIEDYIENDGKKPIILCEYMHDMGNSLGGMNTYMKLIDKYETFQGGFIWDFIDQAIEVKDEISGKQVLRYGGDFDDKMNDFEFSGNGIVFANRKEKPAMQEVRYQYGKKINN